MVDGHICSMCFCSPGQMRAEKCNICVSGIKDIEETVWSPRWGLKGKVDITAQVKVSYICEICAH